MKRIIQTCLFICSCLCVIPMLSRAQQSNLIYSRASLRQIIRSHNKVIALNPANANAFYCRANAKFMLKDYRGALADYNKAIEFNPGKTMAYYNRGFAELRLGDKSASYADFSKARELGIKESADINMEDEPQ